MAMNNNFNLPYPEGLTFYISGRKLWSLVAKNDKNFAVIT